MISSMTRSTHQHQYRDGRKVERRTVNPELVDLPRSDVERSSALAQPEESEDGGKERIRDEVKPTELVNVRGLNPWRLERRGLARVRPNEPSRMMYSFLEEAERRQPRQKESRRLRQYAQSQRQFPRATRRHQLTLAKSSVVTSDETSSCSERRATSSAGSSMTGSTSVSNSTSTTRSETYLAAMRSTRSYDDCCTARDVSRRSLTSCG